MKSSVTKKTLSLFINFTRPYRREFIGGSVGAALAVMSQGMAPPYIVSRLFARLQYAYAHHQTITFHDLLPYLIGFTSVMLLGAACWRIQSFLVWQYEIKVRRDMANAIFQHLQAQSQRFHSDRFGGALVSQTNKFLSAYERLMDDVTWSVIPGVTTITVAIIVLLFVSYVYALVITVIVALYIVLMSRRVVRQMPYNIAEAQHESTQTAALADAITNMSTIRAFAQEEYETARFAGVTERAFRANHTLSIEVLKTEALSNVQTNVFQILALLVGIVAITQYHANVSVLYLLLAYTQNIVNNLWQFSRLVRNVNRSLGDAVEMTEILHLEPEIANPSQPLAQHIHRGEIAFQRVRFAYAEDATKPLFNDLSFKVKPGEKIGLVGPSGGGKTTITKLLLRFMDIQSGTIRIDGQDIAALKQADLRSRIASVPQEPMLFHRTIEENIRYGSPAASRQEIEAVARMANAHEFICQLPDGYRTLVGERGVKLSGGQRQRVAIARAMLKNAPILILDEATSALDSESETLIQDALWRLMEGRTAIVIAHRLSTIQKMDRIIVLAGGRIVEQGTHKELIRQEGTYAKLWAHQSGGFIEE
ncbi:MAG TPA: ABC transporter ATP-binding protein [Candidatus Saccharimonadales bacterium]|nr:ABC transporter ATP-binding protein [Candidatus Saccharimonadales bacterium]